jgi:hypothetical protein
MSQEFELFQMMDKLLDIILKVGHIPEFDAVVYDTGILAAVLIKKLKNSMA